MRYNPGSSGHTVLRLRVAFPNLPLRIAAVSPAKIRKAFPILSLLIIHDNADFQLTVFDDCVKILLVVKIFNEQGDFMQDQLKTPCQEDLLRDYLVTLNRLSLLSGVDIALFRLTGECVTRYRQKNSSVPEEIFRQVSAAALKKCRIEWPPIYPPAACPCIKARNPVFSVWLLPLEKWFLFSCSARLC